MSNGMKAALGVCAVLAIVLFVKYFNPKKDVDTKIPTVNLPIPVPTETGAITNAVEDESLDHFPN